MKNKCNRVFWFFKSRITIIAMLINNNNMRNKKQFMLLLGIPAILFTLLSSKPISVNEERDILIHPDPLEDPDAPRSSPVRISAYVDTDLACVFATLSNAGTLVDVYVENRTTGETSACQISGNNSSVIPISGTLGNWIITFTLPGGDVYYGEFMI